MKPYENIDSADLPGETWRDIPGFVGRYQASSLGRIKSLPNKVRKTTIVLRQQAHVRTGYLQVSLTSNDGSGWKQRKHWVARLVALAFCGPCPAGFEACHENGQKLENHESNLRWGTPQSNQADRAKHGTANIGKQNPRAKLDENGARKIKLRLKAGEKVDLIAKDFGLSVSAIKHIKNGSNWSHVHV